MLQTCIDMKLFQYGMIAAGILGVWCLFWSNHFYNRALGDLKRKDKPKSKWTSSVLEESKNKLLEDPDSYIRVKLAEARGAGTHVGRLHQGANLSLCICGLLFALAGYTVLKYHYETYVLWRHGLLAGAIACGILMIKFCQNQPDKEDLLVDAWRNYFENIKGRARERAQPEVFPATVQERESIRKKKERRQEQSNTNMEEQITQIEKGIREAAASDSRFAGVLTPEEETLFREVIREYMN